MSRDKLLFSESQMLKRVMATNSSLVDGHPTACSGEGGHENSYSRAVGYLIQLFDKPKQPI